MNRSTASGLRGPNAFALASLVIICAVFLALALSTPAGALPEYASQTGEPCATCHVSPSGGGLRTPRGQAWVGSQRPGTVPALDDALAFLGVHLTVNQADYLASANPPAPAEKPSALSSNQVQMRRWLNTYEGN